MADYNSPSAFLQNPSTPIYPALGYIRGLQMANMQAMIQRSLQNQDIANQTAQAESEMKQSDVEPHVLTNQMTSQRDIGAMPFQRNIGQGSALAAYLGSQADVQDKRTAILGAIGNDLTVNPVQTDSNGNLSPGDQGRITQYQRVLSSMGLGGDYDLTTQSGRDSISGFAKSQENTPKQRQDLAKLAVGAGAKVEIANTQALAKQETERIRGEYAKQRTQDIIEGQNARLRMLTEAGKNADQAISTIVGNIPATGPTPNIVNSLVSLYAQKERESMTEKMFQTINSARAAGRELSQAEITQMDMDVGNRAFAAAKNDVINSLGKTYPSITDMINGTGGSTTQQTTQQPATKASGTNKGYSVGQVVALPNGKKVIVKAIDASGRVTQADNYTGQ